MQMHTHIHNHITISEPRHTYDYDYNLYRQICSNDYIFKRIHLKQCILYRKFIKSIILTLNLPEKVIETTILNYVGTSRYPIQIHLR